MIRILQYIGTLNIGGSQSFLMELYRNIDKSKFQFDFIVFDTDINEEMYNEIINLGGKIYTIPKYNLLNHLLFKKWWNDFFRKHPEYKIIHGHVRSTAAIYMKIAKKYGVKTIIHSHSTSNGTGIKAIGRKILQRNITKYADYFFYCSQISGEWLFGKEIVNSNKSFFIPNGIDMDKFNFSIKIRNEIRKKLNIRDNELLIGHVGRFTEPKNHKFIIEIFSEALKKDNRLKLILVGDGELKDKIEKYIDENKIKDKVILTGAVKNTYDYYNAMDLFFFPSLWEGLPVSVVEAQSNGLECLLSDSITEDVTLTNLITKCNLNSPKDKWVNKILSLINNKKRNGLSEIEKQKLEMFNSKNVSKRTEKMYLKILEE